MLVFLFLKNVGKVYTFKIKKNIHHSKSHHSNKIVRLLEFSGIVSL